MVPCLVSFGELAGNPAAATVCSFAKTVLGSSSGHNGSGLDYSL
jgi:hypothetical protein